MQPSKIHRNKKRMANFDIPDPNKYKYKNLGLFYYRNMKAFYSK